MGLGLGGYPSQVEKGSKTFSSQNFPIVKFQTGGRLTEIHLIEIVFYHLIKISIISWPNFLTLFTWSKFVIMILVKRLNFRPLTKLFDQLPKSVRSILAVDRNFLKLKIPLLELSINCQKRTDRFWQLIETF